MNLSSELEDALPKYQDQNFKTVKVQSSILMQRERLAARVYSKLEVMDSEIKHTGWFLSQTIGFHRSES
jgi:hypothetical protein